MEEETEQRKRQRPDKPTVEDLLKKARETWGRSPDKSQSTMVEDRSFRKFFGCGALVALQVWSLLFTTGTIPLGGTLMHLLWTLLLLKVYPKSAVLARLCGADAKTIRKYVWGEIDASAIGFIEAIANLEPLVVSKTVVASVAALIYIVSHSFQIIWENRLKKDKGNDCLVSVDGTDFRIPNHGKQFSSHKCKKKSALRCEVGLCTLAGDIVWVNGPCECGMWPDMSIFRNCLMSHLAPNERVEVDDGHIGEAPAKCKCPKCFTNEQHKECMQQRVRNRQETVNKRFKDWDILKTNDYRHDITAHGEVFRAIAIIAQLSINNGEQLFDTHYDDNPPWDKEEDDDDYDPNQEDDEEGSMLSDGM